MQHIYVNFKRFDVPASMGGVNRLSDAKDYASTIVKAVCPDLKAYAGKAEFVHFYPESLLPSAIEGADPSILSIGCQGVYRADVAPGGNFGAFTTNRPAAAMAAIRPEAPPPITSTLFMTAVPVLRPQASAETSGFQISHEARSDLPENIRRTAA